MNDNDSWVRPTVLNSPLDPTRARPEPWFVGSGKGLMIGVVTLCAVLIAVRIASVVWLAEEAWRWWRSAPSADIGLSPPLQREAPAPPPRAIPPPDPARANATLRGNPGLAFSADSYPPDALRRGEQGRTVASLQIDASGTPVSCAVETSSGSPALDNATCRIALRRVRFDPARDGAGVPIPSRYKLPVRWQIPQDNAPGSGR